MIENYLLHEQIGQGEYGRVYRATDIQTQSIFAVKVVETNKLNENPKLLELSLTEIKVLQLVSHCPYIVHFIQLIKTPLKYYFVYEYCAGGPLDKMLSLQGHFAESKALQVIWQLLQAFKTLQQNRIMHRDLKPSNILIQNGTYKLADFGFCKPMEAAFGDVTTTMLGSPIYMAPEVLRGLSYDNRADVWSLGAVMYELLVGRCPFEEKSIAKYQFEIISVRLITAQDETDWAVPVQFQFKPQTMTLLRSMLVKDPTKRCTWEYLFSQPLTKDGEYIGEVRPYESEPIMKQPLQQLDNFNNKEQFATFQQFNMPYSPVYKKELLKAYSPMKNFEALRDNTNTQDQLKKPSLDSFKTFSRGNTFQIPADSTAKTPDLVNQISLPPLHKNTSESSQENILSEVVRERNKIYFLCRTLGDINKYNFNEKSFFCGYAVLQLITRRFSALIKVARQYQTLTEVTEYPSLNRLLTTLQRRNTVKKLVNNFEFVRLVDTIEKEANAINISATEYRSMIESMKIELDRKETMILQNTGDSRVILNYIFSYVNGLRAQHYMAFIDYKTETDKHIVQHSLQALDCLNLDVYFDGLANSDEVIEEFDSYASFDKRSLNDKFEESLKRVTPLIT